MERIEPDSYASEQGSVAISYEQSNEQPVSV
jgi:hypothetical protein